MVPSIAAKGPARRAGCQTAVVPRLHCSRTLRYNLKRKIARLPPVTREWYEARKAQLLASAATPVQRVWYDPLTRRKFYSENTYLAFTR